MTKISFGTNAIYFIDKLGTRVSFLISLGISSSLMTLPNPNPPKQNYN